MTAPLVSTRIAPVLRNRHMRDSSLRLHFDAGGRGSLRFFLEGIQVSYRDHVQRSTSHGPERNHGVRASFETCTTLLSYFGSILAFHCGRSSLLFLRRGSPDCELQNRYFPVTYQLWQITGEPLPIPSPRPGSRLTIARQNAVGWFPGFGQTVSLTQTEIPLIIY